MSIALIVTRGYGNGTLTGSIKDVVLRGYEIGTNLDLDNPVGISSLLSSRGKGLASSISIAATGVQSSIITTHGIRTNIQTTFGVASLIDSTGKGVGST